MRSRLARWKNDIIARIPAALHPEVVPTPLPPTAWAPTDASVGVLAWYRADLGVTAPAGVVSNVADQTGTDANKHLVNSGVVTVAADAAYGGREVFTHATASLKRPGPWAVAAAPPLTIVFVGNNDGGGYNSSFVSSGPTANLLWAQTSLAIEWYPGGPHLVASATSPSVIMYSDEGGVAADAAKLYVDNLSTPALTGLAAATSDFGFDIGEASSGIGSLTGRCAEVIIFGGILTPTDVANLKTYLNTTRAYGIAVT